MDLEKGYENILVAIDRTPEAEEVVAAAQRVASQNGAQLNLLTVVKPVTHAYAGYDSVGAAALTSLESDLIDGAQSGLEERAASLGLGKEQVAVKVGRPSGVIRAHAEEIGADLIVLGSHCRHGVGLLLGSTATGVLHGAPCDVLTLRIVE